MTGVDDELLDGVTVAELVKALDDDALIDALSRARFGDDTELVMALAACWRRECRGEPVDVDQAAAIVRQAMR